MQLYGIGDLHLSLGVPEKPMDIFHGWENYMQLLEQHWRAMVQPEDTVVLAGDLSWGMTLPQAKADFAFLETLPGQKIILKGNHDYWWNSMKKMQQFFADNGFDSLHILHNNHYAFQQYGICGTRGWVSINGETADAKVLAREVQRLEVSIQSALKEQLTPIVFLHYPPVYTGTSAPEIVATLKEYGIRTCFYGHLHGNAIRYAVQGDVDGIHYKLVSADGLRFCPYRIN